MLNTHYRTGAKGQERNGALSGLN